MKLDLKQPRPGGIFLASVYTFLLPLTLALIYGGGDYAYFVDVLCRNWIGVLFYGVLGLCVLSLNNKLRLGVVIVLSWMALAGPLGLIIAISQTLPSHAQIIKRYGIQVLLYPWMMIVGAALLFAVVPFYLTRPKIKELFH